MVDPLLVVVIIAIIAIGASSIWASLPPSERALKRALRRTGEWGTASSVLLVCGSLGSLVLVGCSNNAIDAEKTKWEDKGWTYFETVGKPIENARYISHMSAPTASSVTAMATADSRPFRKEYHQEEFVYLIVTMGPDTMHTFSLVFYKPRFAGAKHHQITEGDASLVPQSLPKLAFDIDGSVADWTAGITVCDDLGVSTGNEPEWFVDVERVMVHSDKTFLYVFVECSPSIEEMFARRVGLSELLFHDQSSKTMWRSISQ